MNPAILVTGSIALLLFAIAYIRIPIGLLLGILGFSGYALLDGFDMAVVMTGNEFWSTFSGTGLTVIPLFVFMGQLCFHSGLSARLYQAVAAWVGHLRGGVAAATLAACGAFAAICGSNTATAATMSVVSLPEMKRFGYDSSFAAGVVATGTTLGAVIPPSVVAIVLGVQTGLSIRKLFIGGVIPGLMLLAFFLVTVTVLARRRPDLAPAGERVSLDDRIKSLPGLLEALLLFILVVGGLSIGAFTPTEAGAAGSAFALFIAGLRRSLSLRALYTAGVETMFVTAMIFLLLAGAGCYGKFLSLSRIPFLVARAVEQMNVSPMLVLLLVYVVFLIGGMLMDALALLLITIPIFFPLVKNLGFDPMWFCIVLLVITTLGAITPPVGASAFVVASMGRLSLGSVFRGCLVFMPAFFLCLAIMTLFPQLVLWLPELVR